ncbi:hypothetical protein FSP39_023151 [Pinctada imbricata]|uniref:F-box domain-containing protein n=1 Tax=Pinctada imbricata TaxID=66713 RepID=A0AA89BRS7_PINIB|nr:hypothetical protein FSP39_023151 [Pinctada imbricata]
MDNLAMDFSLEDECYWHMLPENILVHVFSYLPAPSLLKASMVCRCWNRVAFDELLWKDLFYRHWSINREIGLAPGRSSWFQEYKRLYYRVPCIESENVSKHTDQVLHVNFSHNGEMFSTCSKDGFIKVWNSTYPTSLRYKYNMKELAWKYTQYSQFNENDSLLLVSGVHFGPNSTSGEIAVFSLTGDFEMQARVINKPYDVFGTWYNNDYLLSGNLHWIGQLQSCSSLWLNKAYQATESEHESVVMRLYRFQNVNASSIRTIMIAKCLNDQENNNTCQCETHCCQAKCLNSNTGGIFSVEGDNFACSSNVLDGTCPETPAPSDNVCQKIQHLTMFEDGSFKTKMIAVDSDSCLGRLNGTFEYNSEYRAAEGGMSPPQSSTLSATDVKDVLMTSDSSSDMKSLESASGVSGLKRSLQCNRDVKGQITRRGSEGKMMKTSELNLDSADGTVKSQTKSLKCNSMTKQGSSCGCDLDKKIRSSASDFSMPSVNSSQCVSDLATEDRDCECCDHCSNGLYLDGSVNGYPLQSNFFLGSDHSHAVLDWNPFSPLHDGDDSVRYSLSENSTKRDGKSSHTDTSAAELFPDKYLIFTMGEKTYTPHQIGIKRIKAVEKITKNGVQVLPNVEENLHGMDRADFDDVDHTIDLHGHIIGMCLSPDHRYLYVNSRPWPKNYVIENVLYPPPIAQEIDVHVIDLVKMREVGKMFQAHKAYTPNDECFFIFLDVCDEYVASGAEDKHGYIWDRHYGICLNKFPHTDVVNCVAFNPRDSEMLVTVSDDQSIRIWRSRHHQKHLNKIPDTRWCNSS